MSNVVQFGKLVRSARRSKIPRISQTQLAKKVGVTQSFISDLENGHLRLGPRDPEILKSIADYLDISLENSVSSAISVAPAQPAEFTSLNEIPSGFRDKIRTNRFVVTMEIHPPKGVGLKRFQKEAMELKNFADAVNVTDNQRALLKLSPVAGSRMLLEFGIEPICQIACRDRNRLGLQSEILSAYVLGVRNFFIIMGDPPEIGDHPDAQPVFDLHSVQMLEVAARLRTGWDMSGNRLNKSPSDIFLGSACNPFPLDTAVEVSKIRAKMRAGAEFFQSQPVYEPARFREFLKLVKPYGAKIIAGYIPILDHKTLEMLTGIPGIRLPDRIASHLSKTDDIGREGLAIAIDHIHELSEFSDGIHLMNISKVEPSLKVMEGMG
ncbi:MAG TPA: helix-turn-helix domain-containing protein [Firmicutes bacterium]|nr:helix-turn-helix domain-containing protein [Bacillota bacterium]